MFALYSPERYPKKTVVFRTPELPSLNGRKSVRYFHRIRRVFRTRLEGRPSGRNANTQGAAYVSPRPTFRSQSCDASAVHALAGSPEFRASRPRRGNSGADAIPNEFSLELRDAREDAENETSVRCRGVYALVERHKLNSERVELAERIYELSETSGKPVVTIDDNDVESSLPTRRRELIELWSPFLRAAHADVGELGANLPPAAIAVFA
jgi:hypothetical protein